QGDTHATRGVDREEHRGLPSLGDHVRLRRPRRGPPRAAHRRAPAGHAPDPRDRRPRRHDRPAHERYREGRRRPHARGPPPPLGAERLMERVRGRFVVLAVTGSIAVYKMIELARRLTQAGAAGPGRLAALERIASAIDDALATSGALAGRHVVVTAGPTVEAIDPVRFVSNRSSGKMGYAIAAAARDAGAEVTLVTGPTAIA